MRSGRTYRPGAPIPAGTLCVALLLFLLTATGSLIAQDGPRISIGLGSSTTRGIVEGRAPIYYGGEECGVFRSGTSSGGDVTMHVIFTDLFFPEFFLAVNPVWRSETSRLTQRESSGAWVFYPDAGNDVEVPPQAMEIDREFQLETRSESFRLQVLGGMSFGEKYRFLIGAGPVFGVTYRTGSVQTDQILGPEDIAFPDGQSRRSMELGADYRTQPVSLGVATEGRVELPLGEQLHLAFNLSACYDLLSPVTGGSWRTFRAGGGIGLQYHLQPRKKMLIPIDVHAKEDLKVPPPRAHISAAIEIYAMKDSREARDIEVLFEETDLCTVIYPPTTLRNPEEQLVALHVEDSLQMTDLVQRPDSLLRKRQFDIAGLSLREFDTSHIEVLYPLSDGAEGMQRGENVRRELIQRHGINPLQIGVTGTTADSIPAGGVRLVARGEPSLPPIRARRLDREFEAPTVRVRTSQEAEAGVNAWEITLSNDRREIARYSSAQPEARGNSGIDWSMLYGESDIDSSLLSAVFMVEDSIGGRAIARSSNQMVIRKVRIFAGRIVDLEQGRTIMILALPNERRRELDPYGIDVLLSAVKSHSTPDSEYQAAMPMADRLPGKSAQILSDGEIERILERFYECGHPTDEIDRSTAIVIERELPD